MCNSQKTLSKADATYLRKIKKPLIEKRRRERMNRSLEQLKDILLESNKEKQNQLSRLDKAEILEMTLTLVQNLQNQQRSVVKTEDVVRAYQSGFKDCARHTISYLSSTKGLGSTELSRLDNHLHNAYNERVSAEPQSFSNVPVLRPKATYPQRGLQTHLGHPVSQQPVNNFPVQPFQKRQCVSLDAVTSYAPPTFPVVHTGEGHAVNIFREETPWRPW